MRLTSLVRTKSRCVRSLWMRKNLIFTETVKIDKLDLSTQFHEGLGKESELYKKYDLRKGFKNFLINDEGVIIAANVTPEKLTEILKAI